MSWSETSSPGEPRRAHPSPSRRPWAKEVRSEVCLIVRENYARKQLLLFLGHTVILKATHTGLFHPHRQRKLRWTPSLQSREQPGCSGQAKAVLQGKQPESSSCTLTSHRQTPSKNEANLVSKSQHVWKYTSTYKPWPTGTAFLLRAACRCPKQAVHLCSFFPPCPKIWTTAHTALWCVGAHWGKQQFKLLLEMLFLQL